MNEVDRLDRRVKALEAIPPMTDARRQRYRAAINALNQWATDAAAVTVTSGNTIPVLQTVVTRFGLLCDHMADLLEDEISRRPRSS